MKNRLFALLAFILFTAGNVFGAIYYIDDQKGNDQNTGTAPETAWKTVRQVNQFDFKPGDSILFKRGGVWRGGISCKEGAPNNPITYASYGEGKKPVIMGSIPLVKESDWNQVPDRDHIWATCKPSVSKEKIPCEAIRKINWQHYCDGEGKINFKIQKGENGQKEYQLTCLNSGKKASNIQLTLAPFEVISDKAFILRFRAKASIPFPLKNISLMRKNAPWGSLGSQSAAPSEIGTEWKEYEVLFLTSKSDKDGRLSFFLGENFPKGCVFSFVPLEAWHADVQSNGINIDVGNMILIENGKKEKIAGFKRWSIDELKEQADYYYQPETNIVYFYSNVNPAQKYQMIEAALKRHIFAMNAHTVIDGFTMINGAAHGVGGGGVCANDVVIRNSEISWIGGGHLYTRNGRCTRYGNGVEFYGGGIDCLVENNVFSEIYDVAMTIQGKGEVLNENIIWRNNIIHHCEQAYEIWFSEENSEIRNVVFENNTCVDAGICWGHRQRPNKRGTHLLGYGLKTKKIDQIIRNNIFTGTNQCLIWYYNDRLAEIKIDHNVWWDDSMGTGSEKEKGLFSWNANRTQVSYEEYRKKTGNDLHSKVVKPIFADPEHFDYRVINREEIGNAGAKIAD
ncbi:MAG: hypothetical protein Q4G69_12815 [Planctomycetia bacterium]|nr:hypothetical protein [Planctomycetia bacterium]